MIILIDGFWGSGKTTIRYLLDGHSELKVSPSQESIISAFERNKTTCSGIFPETSLIFPRLAEPVAL